MQAFAKKCLDRIPSSADSKKKNNVQKRDGSSDAKKERISRPERSTTFSEGTTPRSRKTSSKLPDSETLNAEFSHLVVCFLQIVRGYNFRFRKNFIYHLKNRKNF